MSDIEKSSGNVFADLDIANPEEYRVKADIALKIIEQLTKRSLTQSQAAKIVGVSQPDISNLKNGVLRGFTIDRLLHLLFRLNVSVDIKFRIIKRNASPQPKSAAVKRSLVTRTISKQKPVVRTISKHKPIVRSLVKSPKRPHAKAPAN